MGGERPVLRVHPEGDVSARRDRREAEGQQGREGGHGEAGGSHRSAPKRIAHPARYRGALSKATKPSSAVRKRSS